MDRNEREIVVITRGLKVWEPKERTHNLKQGMSVVAGKLERSATTGVCID